MADLGTLTISDVSTPGRSFGLDEWAAYTVASIGQIVPWRSNFLLGYSPGGTEYVTGASRPAFNGTISGTVKENGVIVPNARLMLISRKADQGLVLAYGDSDVNGAFSFAGLETTEQYGVMVLDPAGGVSYNAMIYDKVTPV